MKLTRHFLLTLMLGFSSGIALAVETEEHDPAEIAIGERLFLETRFAQAYSARPGKADPVMDTTVMTSGELRGPFAGKTMNCRSCHMVDEHADNPAGGMRSYADFASRSPVPAREDGAKTSGRNAMMMVNIAIAREHGRLFHYDGEFTSLEDLVRATFSGRNLGWLAGEKQTAIRHVANVIRQDDGQGELAREFGGSYRKVLKGTARDIPEALRLPPEYRIDVDKAGDQEIFDGVAKLVAAYVRDLNFARDDAGNYIGSPYDAFLAKNNLPRQPAKGESMQAYSQRLLKAVSALDNPIFVTEKDGKFETHQQKFVFGKKELTGMQLFFRKAGKNTRGGNCVSCHTAPHFSDFGFHNTGLTQQNYDQLHGAGAFMKLAIPDLATRNRHYERYLPATAQHPRASGRFRAIPARDKPGVTDLGLWNVFANPDMPGPQAKLKQYMCEQANRRGIKECDDSRLLPLTVAAFKTPVLRDLGHSGPYTHTGQFDTLPQVVNFYATSSATAGQIRSGAPELEHIKLNQNDVELIVAFLRALNEDYD